MPLCGSNNCGCVFGSVSATTGELDGNLPTIHVAGNGSPPSPWMLNLDNGWVNALVKKTHPAIAAFAEMGANNVPLPPGEFRVYLGMEARIKTKKDHVYHLTTYCLVQSSVATDRIGIEIIEIIPPSNAVRQEQSVRPGVVNGPVGAQCEWTFAATEDSTRVFVASMYRAVGTGTITALSGGQTMGQIIAVDLGTPDP